MSSVYLDSKLALEPNDRRVIKASSAQTRPTNSAIALGLRGSNTRPLMPSCTMIGRDPIFETALGVPAAKASCNTIGNPSNDIEGTNRSFATETSRIAISGATAPRNSMLVPPRDFARRSSEARSGPSPMIRNGGALAPISSHPRIRNSAPFSGVNLPTKSAFSFLSCQGTTGGEPLKKFGFTWSRFAGRPAAINLSR